MNKFENTTLKEMEEYLTNIWQTRVKHKDREVVIGRGCDYRGMVTESSKIFGINHCGHNDCVGCNNYASQFHEAVKDWVNKNYTPMADEDFALQTTTVKVGDKELEIIYDPIKEEE